MIQPKLRGPVFALSLAGAMSFAVSAGAQLRAPANTLSSGFLEAAPGVPPIRRERAESYGVPPPTRRAAFARFTRDVGVAWQGLWDRDTGAPVRLFGAGLPAPATVASAKAASAHARAFLAERLDLLAPGASIQHFQEVANDLDQGLRTVGFVQLAPNTSGVAVPVIGGRMSLRYRNDRLFMVASEAYPLAGDGPLPAPVIDGAAAETAAFAWVAERHATATLCLDGAASGPKPRAPSGPFRGAELCALPLVGSGRRGFGGEAPIGDRLRAAYRVEIDALSPRARYAIYIDARTGQRLAAEQLLRFEQTPVLFDTPIRAPQLGRAPFPAPFEDVTIDGVMGKTDAQGVLSWPAGPGALTLTAQGTLAIVHNTHLGGDASGMFNAVNATPVIWSEAGDVRKDAQLSAYIHANIVKAHAKGIAPMMSWLNGKLPVSVNIDDPPSGCNAYWNGMSLNFLDQSQACNNTALLPDVVYHEFGHGFHQYAVIAGVGALDPSLGEGAADTMAVSLTHDSRLAPGFFLGGDTPLRELASGRRWPDDISSADPHETGLIYGGAMWDLRTFLVKDLGALAGNALTDQLYYQTIRRASNILTTYPEILAADDDDGDLSNGTPHICAINRAFIAHGLASVLNEAGLTLSHEALGLVAAGDDPYPIKVKTEILYPQCNGAPIDWVRAHVVLPKQSKDMPLAPSGSDYVGEIPAQKDGTAFRYRIEASLGGVVSSLPANRADDQYQVFAGAVEPIYCNDFESQIDGFSFGDTLGGSGDFQWDAPAGNAGDPAAAYSGKRVIGDRVIGDGAYKKVRTVFADSPTIDLMGRPRVRLQFRRWLTCQDGALDQATMYVNGKFLWQNQGTTQVDGSLTFTDTEWRFQDVDLAPFLSHGETTVQLRFELASDATVQYGGWNIDDLCVISWSPPYPEIGVIPSGDGDSTSGGLGLYPSGGCLCEAAPGGAAGGDAPVLVVLALGALLERRRRGARRG